MGIIGVVAALTLPNLNNSTGDKEKVVKVKKIYNNLQDAMVRAQAVYGPTETWFFNDTTAAAQRTRFAQRLTEFMKISKATNTTTANVFILADGTAITINNPSSSGYVNDMDFVVADIDGSQKGKNKRGYDIFHFIYSNVTNNIEPAGSVLSSTSPLVCCSKDEDNRYCSKWVIDYDNMDYLKVGFDKKCPDGKTVLNDYANPPVISCK